MKIVLYRNNSDNRCIDKKLSKYCECKCNIKGDLSIYEPVFEVNESNIDNVFSSVNYLKCTDLGRCYFITDVKVLTGGVVEIHCKVDVLQSFASYIKNSSGVIFKTETESISNPYLEDGDIITSKQRIYTQYNFSGSPFNVVNMNTGINCVALTVTGGGV